MNTARPACWSAISGAPPMSTPIRRMRSGCCAPAASGHAATAPPRSTMNSRRLIVALRGQNHAPHRVTAVWVLERDERDVNCDQLFWAGNVVSGSTGSNRKSSVSGNAFPVCPPKRTYLPILELLPPAAFRERRHRDLACRLVAVGRRAVLMMSREATSACWCRISRATSLAGARRGAVLKAKPYGGLDGDDEAIVHAQKLLSRPAALQLVARRARGAHSKLPPF